MSPLIRFFQANEVIVYSVYGQVFFIMGITIAVHSMQHSRLYMARHLWLLAGFGLTHGMVEWGHVFIPIQASYMPEGFVEGLGLLQFLLLVISFLFLVCFGATLSFRGGGRRLSLAFGLPVAAWSIAITASVVFGDGDLLLAGEVWARYFLAAPACLMTGVGLLKEGGEVEEMGLPHIARFLRLAAISVWVYGLFSGLFTPAYNALSLTQWANQDLFFHIIGLPIPVVRSVAALVMAYGIVRSLDVFRVETDRLLQEARDQKLLVAQRELEALSAIGVAMGQSGEIRSILANGLERVLEILRLERGAVFLTMGHPPAMTPVLCHCDRKARGQGARCHVCLGLAREMQASEERVMLQPLPSGAQGLGIALVAGSGPLGAMTLHTPQPLDLPPEARQLLTSIGTQIGVAVENARLWEEVRRKEATREQLLQRIITAQEEERKRIARELHDETGQALTALVIQLGAAGEALPPRAGRTRLILEQCGQRLRQALDDVRKLISDLRPTLLDDLGLVPALRRHLESVGTIHGLRTRLRAEGLPARLPSHLETALFRIVQEGVTNAVKHAGASELTVTLALEGDQVLARVQDNGRGFDVGGVVATESARGFGLLGIRERVTLLGGTLITHSEPCRGTELVARIPLGEEAKQDGQDDPTVAGG